MVFARFGFPYSLKTDNGPQFRSEQFSEYLEAHGILHVTSPPMWPQANGEAEVFNKSVGKVMKIAQIEKKKYKPEVLKFLLAYRTTPHCTTGVSPASLMFSFGLRTKLPSLRPEMDTRDEDVRDKDWKYKLGGKKYADERRGAAVSSVLPGDKVLVKNYEREKLEPRFKPEPYEVVKRQGNEITVEKDGTAYKRNVAHTKPIIIATSKPVVMNNMTNNY